MLCKHNETGDNIKAAADLLQDIQVETYGSMDRREKVEFILYQMRIMIKMNDQIRLQMVSKKLNEKNINHAGIEDLKVRYYAYLIHYHNHANNYGQVSQFYKIIYDTYVSNAEVQEKLGKELDFGFSLEEENLLENLVLYLAVSPFSMER